LLAEPIGAGESGRTTGLIAAETPETVVGPETKPVPAAHSLLAVAVDHALRHPGLALAVHADIPDRAIVVCPALGRVDASIIDTPVAGWAIGIGITFRSQHAAAIDALVAGRTVVVQAVGRHAFAELANQISRAVGVLLAFWRYDHAFSPFAGVPLRAVAVVIALGTDPAMAIDALVTSRTVVVGFTGRTGIDAYSAFADLISRTILVTHAACRQAAHMPVADVHTSESVSAIVIRDAYFGHTPATVEQK
jgi:hypothetical protein